MVVTAALWMAGCQQLDTTGSRGEDPAAPAPVATASADGGRRADLRFLDRTEAAGLAAFRHHNGARGEKWFPEIMGAGVAFLDYDGDDWLDVLMVGGGWLDRDASEVPAVVLYRNHGDGTFALVSAQAGLAGLRAYAQGLTVADYDNDGDADVFVTTLAEDLLLRNDGGIFHEVGQVAGAAGPARWSSAAAFFDADGDGWLDLFVGGYVEWSADRDVFCSLDGQTKSYCTPERYPPTPGRFLRNQGDGSFADETTSRGFDPARGKTLGAVTVDFDHDGHTDLFVANDTANDQLFHNRGDGTFVEVGQEMGVASDENGRARGGMGVDAGVLDGSGAASLVVGNFSKEMIGVFRYEDGSFVDRAIASRIGIASLLTLTFGMTLADFDLDGDLDLFTANGHVQEEVHNARDGVDYRQPPHLFLNQGDGIFADIAPELGDIWQQPLLARGVATGDYDRDGDLDLLISENGGAVHLWQNEASASYLRIRVEDRQGNRDAIGARVVVTPSEPGVRDVIRTVSSGASYLSSSEKTITIGLGAAHGAARVRVDWPGGESVSTERRGVDAGQQILILRAPKTDDGASP